MFYSHEILQSRKYGVATVWLVATLGANEARKKLNKSEIQKVDVPKACETITSTETPLALRLQSNLLFGVSKVYSQQCVYVLNDAEQVRTQVRQAMDTIRANATTTSRNHVAKKDQITVADDPNFNVELDLMAGLEGLGLDFDVFPVLQDSNMLSLGSQSTQPSIEEQFADLDQAICIPSDDDYSADSLRSRSLTRGSGIPAERLSRADSEVSRQAIENALLDDGGLVFGDDGELQEGPFDKTASERQMARGESVAGTINTGRLPNQDYRSEVQQREIDLPLVQDDYNLFPDAESFSPRRPGQDKQLPDLEEDQEMHDSSSEDLEAAAPNRAGRQRRVLPLDTQMELRNRDFSDWDQNYVQTMIHDATNRFNARNPYTAKINAQVWLTGNGLHGIGTILDPSTLPEALQMFVGANLLNTFTTQPGQGSPTSSKRSRTPSTSSSRRVRPRLESREAEQGRFDADAGHPILAHDDLPTLPPDDFEQSLEQARAEGTPLPDRRSSQMPWNISASKHSSVRRFARAGGPGSSSVAGGPLSVGARGSSVAPSPLDRYGVGNTQMDEETFQLPMDETEAVYSVDDLDSQGVRRSSLPWAKGMDTEERNFVEWVSGVMGDGAGRGGMENRTEIEFDEVVRPAEWDRVVASQALMFVLALNGKGIISARQEVDEAFRPIVLSVN
ncbi:Meiotic recombination protein rec8 [Sphaceloma murrayae]|uniref:Meiotic recombination protein rec8 n=1 Tax=Sphaceloma murrayae TaxID=2082308 RepID=A0A2K1QIT9_9PEZI|nr:Meiotic recombination protein rec8 [Sphaceloma murrayae]